jgi:hypothetical protein
MTLPIQTLEKRTRSTKDSSWTARGQQNLAHKDVLILLQGQCLLLDAILGDDIQLHLISLQHARTVTSAPIPNHHPRHGHATSLKSTETGHMPKEKKSSHINPT